MCCVSIIDFTQTDVTVGTAPSSTAAITQITRKMQITNALSGHRARAPHTSGLANGVLAQCLAANVHIGTAVSLKEGRVFRRVAT